MKSRITLSPMAEALRAILVPAIREMEEAERLRLDLSALRARAGLDCGDGDPEPVGRWDSVRVVEVER